MSAPDQSPAPTQPPAHWGWTEDDLDAIFASDHWFHLNAPPELIKQYEGMHVAILGEQIVDGDRDFSELARRIEARRDLPVNRLLFRYVYTPEDLLNFGTSRVGMWPASDSS